MINQITPIKQKTLLLYQAIIHLSHIFAKSQFQYKIRKKELFRSKRKLHQLQILLIIKKMKKIILIIVKVSLTANQLHSIQATHQHQNQNTKKTKFLFL